MGKLTAMQEIIDYLENNTLIDKKVLINKCKSKQEKERQDIIDACIKTTQDCWQTISEEFKIPLEFTEEDLKNQREEAEQYFEQTFKK